MLGPYKTIGVFFLLAFSLCLFLVLLSWVRGKQKPYAEKQTPYECGFDAFTDDDEMRGPFKVQFYLIGILFVIFDIEIALLIPWALSLKTIGIEGYCSMLAFLIIVTIGFMYEWHKKALEWS